MHYLYTHYLTGPLPPVSDSGQSRGATYGTMLPDLVHRVQVTGSARGESSRMETLIVTLLTVNY